jgi:hypothetical protein
MLQVAHSAHNQHAIMFQKRPGLEVVHLVHVKTRMTCVLFTANTLYKVSSMLHALEKQVFQPFVATHSTSLGYDRKLKAVKFLETFNLPENMQHCYI